MINQHKIVARFSNGSVLKGVTNDFTPLKTFFNLKLENGEMKTIDTDELKAVFFIKESESDQVPEDTYKNIANYGGKKVKVHFHDGEIIIGYTMEYVSDYNGFFITPADQESNNERIFVFTAATDKITFF
jgi:hypothetical protein